MSYGPIPEVDEEQEHGRVWLVPAQDTNARKFAQELKAMADGTEDPAGRSAERYGKRKNRLKVRDLFADVERVPISDENRNER